MNKHTLSINHKTVATVATQQYWQSLNIPCVFELNSGNHFEQVAQRLAKAADYLLD